VDHDNWGFAEDLPYVPGYLFLPVQVSFLKAEDVGFQFVSCCGSCAPCHIVFINVNTSVDVFGYNV